MDWIKMKYGYQLEKGKNQTSLHVTHDG